MTTIARERPLISEQDAELFNEDGVTLVREILGVEGIELSPEAARIAVLSYMRGYAAGVQSVEVHPEQKPKRGRK